MDHEIFGSDIPVDDDFESYVAGSDISGQGRWFVAKNDPTCTSLIVNRSGNQWLEIYDTTPPPQNIIEAGMNLTENNASKGFARFLFESDDTTGEAVIMLNDGVWSQIGSSITPNASARIRVSSGFFFISDGNVFINVAPASSNIVYEIEIHYKLD
ncbi:hypothetical protein GF325_06990 [Candidatus Bathyarchaeota archaeon]|nr:hypothetical protein [Candidatus Bathyarchaeota archaeon]